MQSIGRHKLVEVEGNHGETIHGNMSIQVGPTETGRVLTFEQKSDKQGTGSVASELPTLGINDLGKEIYSLFVDAVLTRRRPV